MEDISGTLLVLTQIRGRLREGRLGGQQGTTWDSLGPGTKVPTSTHCRQTFKAPCSGFSGPVGVVDARRVQFRKTATHCEL